MNLSSLTKYVASGVGLTAAGALAVGYAASRVSPQQTNPLSVAYESANDFLVGALFRDPYSDLRSSTGDRFVPQLEGRFSNNRRVFYEDGNPFKPLRVEDDHYLAPSVVQGGSRQQSSNFVTEAVGAAVGAAGAIALTRALDSTGAALHRAGSQGRMKYLPQLFEAGMNKPGGTPSMGKNLMPFLLGGAVGGAYGGVPGAAIGGAIGSYVGGYLLMKEEFGPGLRKYPAALLYGAIAGSFIAGGLFKNKEKTVLTDSGSATTRNKGGIVRPDLYKSYNPYQGLNSLAGQSSYDYQNPNPYSYNYSSVARMNALAKEGYKPNYRSNPAYNLKTYQDQVKRPGQSNVLDYINPLFAAVSASFLTVGMGLLAAQQFSQIPRNGGFTKNLLSILGSLNDYDSKKASLEAQDAVIKSSGNLLKSLFKGSPGGVVGSTAKLSGSLVKLAKQELIGNAKGLVLSGVVGLSVFHMLRSYQHDREAVLAGSGDYESAVLIDNNRAIGGAFKGSVLGLVFGYATLETASIGKLKNGLGLGLAAAIGGVAGITIGLGRGDSSNTVSKTVSTGIFGAAAGLSLGYAAQKLSGFTKGKELPIALLLGLAGAVAGFSSSRELVDNPNYKSSTSTALNIYEGRQPSSISNQQAKLVQDKLDLSRYYYEGIATPVDNQNTFYDSGTVGDGFMSFLRAAPKNSLIGSFYELSSDPEFLSLLKAKAAPEGIGVSMGGNISLFNPEGSFKALLNAAGSGFGIPYLIGKGINTATESVGFGRVYKIQGEEGSDNRTVGGSLANAAIYGVGALVAAPTFLSVTERMTKTNIRGKGLAISALAVGAGLLGVLLGDTKIDSAGLGQMSEAINYLTGSPLSSLEAYGLTIGKDTPADTNRGRKGDALDRAYASFGRFFYSGGADITDKTVPLFLGERYQFGQEGKNIILHSKVLVTDSKSGVDAAFVSTGNIGSLIENSRGRENQVNFGMLVKDPAVVAQIRTAVRAINSLTPKDSLAGIADSLPNVILGGQGAASLQRMANFVDRSQGEIYAAFAYPSADALATSFIKKVRTGTEVNLIAQNPYGVKGGGNAESTRALYRKLINEGVNIYMAPKESDLLVHAKAIYTEQDALTTSHNASNSSDKFVVELGIAQHNTESGKAGVQAIKRVISKYGLLNVRDNPDLFKEFFYSEDYAKFKELQRKDPFYSFIRPAALAVIDDDLGKNQGFLYLPTQLSENFSAAYPGSVPQLYTDTYYTLKGKMPVGYKKHLAQNADSQLAPLHRENLLTQAAYATRSVPLVSGVLSFANLLLQGNYGSSINRLFPDLYSPGQGFAGTIAKGVGRILDTATGFYSNEYYENLRSGKLSGGLNKYHKNQYETNQSRGFFENLMGGVTATGTALTSSLAFYFGVSHTLSIARSHFEDIGVDYVTSLLGKTGNNVTDNVLKSWFFAPELLNVFDEVDQAYSGTPNVPKGKQVSDYLEYVMHKAGKAAGMNPGFLNITQDTVDFFDSALLDSQNTNNLIGVLSDRLRETNSSSYAIAKAAVEENIIGINRQTGELDLSRGLVSGFNSPSGGILSTIGSLRRIDQSNFINIIRPALEHITVGTDQELAALNNELNTLQTDVGRSPYLKFADVGDDGSSSYLDELTAEEYGYRRLEKLASSLDKIAEYVPANPLLYFKPYRDMMGITSLKVDKGNGELENYSLRQLISPGFSGLTNFSRRMTRSIGGLNSTENIVKGVADSFKLFEYEYKLWKAEESIASITDKMLSKPSILKLKSVSSSSSPTLLAELTEGLYGDDGAVKKLAGEMDSQPKARELIKSYTKNLDEYNTLLQRTGNSQDAFNSPPPSVFRSIRNVLFSVAPILILDKVLDSQLMRAPSLDLISQVFTDANFIDSEQDKKPRMDYTGAVPGYIKYPLTAAGFLLGGHLLPNFTHRQMAAGGVIERAVDSAVGGKPLLETLNSDLAGETGLGSLLQGLDDSEGVALVKALAKTRTSTKFGYLGAFVGGATALLATQAFFGIASGLLNAAKSFSKGDGFKPQSDSMVAAFSLTAGIRKRFESLNRNNPITAHELGLMEVGYAAANNLLYGKSNRDRQVYTFATQIPNPIFQFTAVSKLDPQGNLLTLGAGFQFLPILGAGSIPPAPFEVRLKPLTTRASQKREQQLGQGSTAAANWLSLLSFPGQLIAVGKDTSFSQVISFVGASSYVASGTSRVENFLRANAGTAVKRELNQIKPLYNIGKFGLETVETLARYSQVPLLVMPNALMKAATSYFNVPKGSLAKLGARSRVLAPYALAYAFAAGITGADGSFANVGSEHGSNYAASELSRFGTVATLTGIYGYGLQTAGVFARSDSFDKVVGNGFIAKKQQQLSAIAKEALDKGLGEAPLVRTAALRLSVASRRIFSISAVLAAAGLGLRGLTQRSFGFLDVISDSQGVPANSEEAAYQRSQGFSPARYQPKNLQEAAGNYLNYLTRSIGGVLGIDKLVYRDDPNAFLSLGGPFGTSEGKAGFRLYTQAQATFVDISGSSYSLGQTMMNSDLSMQLSAALSGLKSTNYDSAPETLYSDRYHKIRGATPRKTPARTYGELSSSESAAAAGNSSAFIGALAHRKAYADNLKHQRPSELSLDLLYEAARTGRLGSKFGFIKPGYSPLATLGSITGEISGGTSSALDTLATSANNFISGLTGAGATSAEEILTLAPREQTNRIPVLSYFSDSLGYALGGFSGKSTAAASGIIAAQQVPLLLLSVGASSTFLVQMAAALAAYNQGGLNQDSLRQAENKRLDFRRKAQIRVGYTEIDGAYSLTLEPRTKGAAKSKLLTLSSQVLADTNTVVAGNAIEVTTRRLNSLSSSTQSVFASYYKGVASLLDPSGSSVLGGIGLQDIKDVSDISNYVKNLKEHVKLNLLERNIAFEKSPIRKFHEILSLGDEGAEAVLGTLDSLEVELNSILGKNVSVEARANLSRVAIASKLQDLDNRLLENATAGFVKDSELKGYTKQIGLGRSRIAGQSSAGLATSEIINKSGYIGLFKEGAAGAGRVISKLVDIVPFYNVASALTKAAATDDKLERSRAAGAAAYYTMQLPSIGIATFGLKALFANPLVGTAIAGAGLGLFVADQYFNKGAASKSIGKAADWFDRNIGSKMTNSLARGYNVLAGIPVINTALTIAGLPFRMLDPVIEGLWKSVENTPAGYMAMSFLLPQGVDQVYDALGAKTPGSNRAGERMEFVSPAEIRRYEAQRLKYNRARSSSIKANLYTEISPFVLGGTVSESERQLEERYFSSGGGFPRVLSPFANSSHVSSLLQMAIGRRQLEADFAGYGSYKKRRLLGYDGLGGGAIASSTYYKASLAYDGTYSGLLKHGLTTLGNIFSSVAGKTSKLADRTYRTLRVLAYRKYRPVGSMIDLFRSIPGQVGGTIGKIANLTPFKITLGALRTPGALFTIGVGAAYIASDQFDKKGKSRGLRLGIAGGVLVAGLGSYSAYKYSSPTTKQAIRTWASNRQLPKLPPIIARSSIFALSAFAITTAASQIAVNLVGTASNYFGLNNESDDWGNKNIANFSSVQSSMILGGVAAGSTFMASSLSTRAQFALARRSTSFYRGLAASLPGAALYAAPAWAVSKIIGLAFSDEGTSGKIEREAQNWATGSFALLGAYRYGLARPFRKPGTSVSRLDLLGGDWRRVKGIGAGIRSTAALVPGAPQIVSITENIINSTVVQNAKNAVSSVVTTLRKFDIGRTIKTNYPKTYRGINRTRIGAIRNFRQAKLLLPFVGKFAYEFAPSVIDAGLYGYAAYDISQLNNRSTRQQYRAAYQNITGVSVNAAAGSLLALKLRSPAAALVVAINAERTVNPLIGKALGDRAYESGEDQTVRNLVLGGSGLAVLASVGYGVRYASNSLQAASKVASSSVVTLGAATAGLTNPRLQLNLLRGTAAPVAARSLLSRSVPAITGLISTVQTSTSIYNLNKLASEAPKDYRIATQDIGKEAASLTTSVINSVSILGGAPGMVVSAVGTAVAEPYISSYFSSTLQRRMQVAGRTSSRRVKELQRAIANDSKVGLIGGTIAGLVIAGAMLATAPVTAPATVVTAGTVALITAAASAAVGAYVGVERFFWGTRSSSFRWMGGKSSREQMQTPVAVRPRQTAIPRRVQATPTLRSVVTPTAIPRPTITPTPTPTSTLITKPVGTSWVVTAPTPKSVRSLPTAKPTPFVTPAQESPVLQSRTPTKGVLQEVFERADRNKDTIVSNFSTASKGLSDSFISFRLSTTLLADNSIKSISRLLEERYQEKLSALDSLAYAEQKLKTFTQNKPALPTFSNFTILDNSASIVATAFNSSPSVFEQFFAGVGSLIGQGVESLVRGVRQIKRVYQRVRKTATIAADRAINTVFGPPEKGGIISSTIESIGRFFGGKSKPLDISFAIPETQVYRSSYKSGKVSNVGNITITGGFMEPQGHSGKPATQAIFSDGKLRNLPASNRNLGIDYVSTDGAAKAWLGGKVTSARLEGGYGYRIRITTDSTYKYQGKDYTIYQAYAHLQASGLRTDLVGKDISQGTKIGLMGGTGVGGKNSYGAHVDLRTWIIVDGRQVDLSPNLLKKVNLVGTTSQKVQQVTNNKNSSTAISKQLPLGAGYESLKILSTVLGTNKYFDQSTAKGRAALATALLIGGGEAFGKGTARKDHFTFMGGTANKMKGFGQFNTTYFLKETSTVQGYMNLIGSMLTGERTLPTGKGKFNSADLAKAVQEGKVNTGSDLVTFVQKRITRVDWQGLYDGMKRVPGLADQLVSYLKQNPASTSTSPEVPTRTSLKNKPPAQIADWATPKQAATRNIIFTSGHRIDINTGTGGTDRIGSVLFKGENRTIESVGTEIAAEVFSSVFKSKGFNVIAPPALPSARGDEARRQYQDKVAAQEVSKNAYALELHFDTPEGGKPGVIPGGKYDPSGKYLNVMDSALAKEFGAFSYYWGVGGKDVRQFPDEKLGGPKRGISILELDKLDSRLTALIQKGVRTGNFDEYRKAILPYAIRAAEALSLNETSAPAKQTTEKLESRVKNLLGYPRQSAQQSLTPNAAQSKQSDQITPLKKAQNSYSTQKRQSKRVAFSKDSSLYKLTVDPTTTDFKFSKGWDQEKTAFADKKSLGFFTGPMFNSWIGTERGRVTPVADLKFGELVYRTDNRSAAKQRAYVSFDKNGRVTFGYGELTSAIEKDSHVFIGGLHSLYNYTRKESSQYQGAYKTAGKQAAILSTSRVRLIYGLQKDGQFTVIQSRKGLTISEAKALAHSQGLIAAYMPDHGSKSRVIVPGVQGFDSTMHNEVGGYDSPTPYLIQVVSKDKPAAKAKTPAAKEKPSQKVQNSKENSGIFISAPQPQRSFKERAINEVKKSISNLDSLRQSLPKFNGQKIKETTQELWDKIPSFDIPSGAGLDGVLPKFRIKQPRLDNKNKQSFAPSVTNEAVSASARNSLTSDSLQPEQLQAITKEYKEQTAALADLQKKGEQKLQNLTVVIAQDTASRKPTEQPNEPFKSSVANAPEIATGAAVSSSEKGLAVRLTTKVDDANHVETTASPLPTHVNREIATRESSGGSMGSGNQDLFGLAVGWMSNQFA